MAAITEGLNTSNIIYVKASSGATPYHMTAEKIEYTWKPVGDVEQAIDFSLDENYINSRLGIDVILNLERNIVASIDVNYLLNTWLPSTTKYFKEDGWAGYIEVVLDQKEVKFANWKDNRNRSRIQISLLKKTVGITV